jgi:AcrR family transcriptional regulator
MARTTTTHDHLQRTAIALFTERGYDDVTVEEIAKAAGVSHMTFFRHFPTKASVLLDDPYDPVIGRLVAQTDAALPPLERIRRALVTAWDEVDEPGDGVTRERLALIVKDDALIAQAWANNRRTEEIIVSALIESGVERLEARIATGAVMGALMAALIDWGEDQGSEPLRRRVTRALAYLSDQAEGAEHG